MQDFRVGSWLVQPQINSISREGESRRLEPQVIEVLVHLHQRAGQVVSKEEFFETVWKGRHVTDEALTNAIWELRRAFGDQAREPRYIETIPKRGYRLIAPTQTPKASFFSSLPRGIWIVAALSVLVAIVLGAAVLMDADQPALSFDGSASGSKASSDRGGEHKPSPEAYEAYRRGRFFWNRRTHDGLRTAVRYFEKAISLDPEYAQAFAGLANAHIILGDHGYVPGRQALEKAKPAVDRSLALDPASAEAWTAQAWVQWVLDWNWQGAEKSFRKSIALDPDYATAHQWLADFLMAAGRLPEAVEESSLAMRLDPLSPIILTTAAEIQFSAGEARQATQLLDKALEIASDFAPAQKLMIELDMRAGRREDAQKRWDILRRRSDVSPIARLYNPEIAPDLNSPSGFDRIVEELRRASDTWPVSALYFAHLYLMAGRDKEALDWLERACQERDRALLHVPTLDHWTDFRGNPRFERFLERIHWPGR